MKLVFINKWLEFEHYKKSAIGVYQLVEQSAKDDGQAMVTVVPTSLCSASLWLKKTTLLDLLFETNNDIETLLSLPYCQSNDIVTPIVLNSRMQKNQQK